MNRALLKQDAKDAMRMATPSPILVTLAYIAVSLAASMILGVISVITGNESGNAGFIGILVYLVVTILISLLLGTIQFGSYVYSLKVFKQCFKTRVGRLFVLLPHDAQNFRAFFMDRPFYAPVVLPVLHSRHHRCAALFSGILCPG